MAPNNVTNDFFWEYSDQPHAKRRLQILRRHPEIRQLMKCSGDPRIAKRGAVIATCLVLIMIISQYVIGRVNRTLLVILVGSYLSSWIFLSIHEAAHGLVFGPNHPKLNQAYGILVNCALGLPVYSFFKKYHKMHHKYQGDYSIDLEYPTNPERLIFDSHPITRFTWLLYNGIFQHIRSAFWKFPDGTPLGNNKIESFLNYAAVFAFDAFLIWIGYRNVVFQLMLSFGVAMGFNMIGVWGMFTHTVFFPQEDTVSYYGSLNLPFLNFGYHMEHHDFPNIPCTLLPQVRKIADEFYRDHHHYECFYPVVFAFMFDQRYGLKARIKRKIERNFH